MPQAVGNYTIFRAFSVKVCNGFVAVVVCFNIFCVAHFISTFLF